MLRDHSCVMVLNDKTRMMSNPVTQQKGFVKYYICAHYSKGASVKKALHSLLYGKIMTIVSRGSLD
jgi:hypothetical protein